MSDEKFLEKYEELLNKDYCNCNEMNCIDNNSPRRILNIAKKQKEVLDKIKLNIEQNVIRMKNGKLLVELDVNEINELLEGIE